MRERPKVQEEPRTQDRADPILSRGSQGNFQNWKLREWKWTFSYTCKSFVPSCCLSFPESNLDGTKGIEMV